MIINESMTALPAVSRGRDTNAHPAGKSWDWMTGK